MWKKAMWIGLPQEEIHEKAILQGDMNGRFVYFRHSFRLEETAKLTIDISAASRYRLWVNGCGVQSGPCRGDRYRHYYETIDVSNYLRQGENVLAVQVLYCDRSYVPKQQHERAPLISVANEPGGHRLAVEGTLLSETGEVLGVVTTGESDWRIYLDHSFYLIGEPVLSDNLGATIEHIDFARVPKHWKESSFSDDGWRRGEPIEPVVWNDFEKSVGLYLKYPMRQRPIPLLMEEEYTLDRELGESHYGTDDRIVIEPQRTKKLLFGLDVLQNTYPSYHFAGGKGTKVSITYFEKFVNAEYSVKRDDFEHGEIGENGLTDVIYLDGGSLTYEPFWYRTFRFLQMEITTADEAVTVFRPDYHKTGYPLQAESHISSSETWVKPLYEMCVHTLEGCMMETYMDCPFWEQMQYPMDTRLQALYTYVCSTDTLLAEKALEDFHNSRIPEGLVLGKAPTGYKQVISTFSFHYIYMMWEFYQRTGKEDILKKYRSDVDAILEYYAGKTGGSGLVEQVDYWPFVDWQIAWMETAGVPSAIEEGPSTIINLMYGYALLVGARIQETSGRTALAEEYRRRQQELCECIQRLCWDEERRMFREGPNFVQFSQHAQSWAVLNGMVKGEQAKELMTRTFAEKDVLRCYFSTCHELFRACELAGCYDLTKQQMDWWIQLLEEHCTTCPETPQDARSECHAWSAQPMYELMETVAGIRTGKPGRKEIYIRPHMEYLPDLSGEMVTEWGMIGFTYEKKEDKWLYRYTIPEGCHVYFVEKSGRKVALGEGIQVVEEL